MHADQEIETPDGVADTPPSAPDKLEPLLTVRDVATVLQLSEEAVRRIIRNGDGPQVHRVGGSIRFFRTDLDEWIRSGAAAQARTTRGYRVPA